jgi:hypothetical protein
MPFLVFSIASRNQEGLMMPRGSLSSFFEERLLYKEKP